MQRKLIFLACFFVCVSCFSQQYPFVHYTPKDGLVNSRVKSIKQDSKGRMYFITYGGLSVYDGTGFTNYDRHSGLANDVINDIAEWNSDTILVSCNDQKLNTLVNGKVGVYQTLDNFYPTSNRFLKSKTGTWYVIADEGLFVLSGKKFTKLPCVLNKADFGRNLDHIVEFENYFLITPWANEWNTGVILYDRDQHRVLDTMSRDRAAIAHIDNKKRIWVNTPQGLKLFNTDSLRKGKLALIPAPKEFSSLLKEKSISLYFDDAGNGWCFSKNKIWKVTPDYKTELISSGEDFKGGFNGIFRDKEGITWMALDGAGAVKLKTTNIQLLNSILPDQSMAFTSIEQKGDTTWLFNRLDNAVYRVTENEVKKFPTAKAMTAYNMLVNGNRIFFSNTRNLFFIENKNDPSSYHHPQYLVQGNADVLGNNIVDPYGALLQLWKKDEDNYFVSVFRNSKKIFEHPVSYMTDQMAIDGRNRLWLATRNGHVLVFRIDPQHPDRYLQLEQDFYKGLPPEMSPRSIALDKQNTIWIGTRFNGIYQFRENGSSLQLLHQYTTSQGLTDNFIYTLCADADDNIWVGTQTGLDKIAYRNRNYVIVNIGKNNNIFQTVWKIKVGENKTMLAMNNDETLIRIIPETSKPDDKVSFFLTSIKVNDSIWRTVSQRFSHQQNNFSFSVAAPSFFDEKSIRYSYWLEGIGNSHWSEPSNISTFNFINLSPGKYTLHMKADFPEAIYPSKTITYSFVILPAWWQTWWSRAGLGVLTVSICVFIIRNYYKRKLERQKALLERKQAIEKERTRIATDMHDDLGAGLSRIKFLSETIGIKKQQEQPIEEEITKIREYSHQMIDKMGEIVWALNERNDSLSDLIAYTRAYAMEYLSQNGIHCKMEMPSHSDTVFLSGEFRRNIFLSVKEILHNIVKHAQANHVFIDIETRKDLRIQIRDDGIGFNPVNVKAYSNGLYNINKRMKDIDGRSEIKGSGGTTVLIAAPLPH